jgi:electron transfer flavoprotein alpha subunit
VFDTTYVVQVEGTAGFQYDSHTSALESAVEASGADIVLIGSTRRGRALAPRLAQRLGAACATDVKAIERRDGRVVTARLALGGNTVKEEAATAAAVVVAITPGAFEAGAPGSVNGSVEELPAVPGSRAVTSSVAAKDRGAVNIEEADRLICIGRGIASADDIPMIEDLARAIGAEVAATRPLAYEYKWMPEDRMVGISGKTVSPELYVVVGSSGQIQHTVSVRDSKLIVAINTDRNAPIFEMADYGLVGDLYELVPQLTEALR